jgi:hypothetical protein
MGELLWGPALWSKIRSQSAAVSRRKAALAYVGADAEQLLRFADGDLVVIDGSKAALRGGATNPYTVEKWIRAGAKLHNYEGLHAKVLLLGNTAIVGSANASWHSHNSLLEAAIVTTDANVRRSVTQMINELVATAIDPIEEPWLRRAKELFRPWRGPKTGVRSGTVGQPLLPPGQFRMTLGRTQGDVGFNPAEHRRDVEVTSELRRRRGPAARYGLWRWVFQPDENLGEDEIVVLVDTRATARAVSSPARVLRVVDLSKRRRVAYLRHDLALPDIELDVAQKAVRGAGGVWAYDRAINSPAVRKALLGLWGLAE